MRAYVGRSLVSEGTGGNPHHDPKTGQFASGGRNGSNIAANRTIKGQKHNVPQIVDAAIAASDRQPLDTEAARQSLLRMGHRSPDKVLVTRYARETAILAALERTTGANFTGQIGKISFASRERTLADVESYLNRRIHGQRVRYIEKYGRR